MNPMVIVEFLSDSTEDSDRTEKFAAYRRLPSLRFGLDPARYR